MKKQLLLLQILCIGISMYAQSDDIIRKLIVVEDSVDGICYRANSNSTAIVVRGKTKPAGDKVIPSEVS